MSKGRCPLYIPGMLSLPWNAVGLWWERGTKFPSLLNLVTAPLLVLLILAMVARIPSTSHKTAILSKR
jgi:hypothetical protein